MISRRRRALVWIVPAMLGDRPGYGSPNDRKAFGVAFEELLTMAEQNGNGADTPQAGPKFSVLAQYTKDFSFENPNAPRTLGPQQTQPNISIQINVNAR